jgi:hypothetical protein
MLFVAICTLSLALLFAAATYLLAALFYAAKGEPRGVVEQDDHEPQKKRGNLVGVGILVVVGVIAASKPGRDALSYVFSHSKQNPASLPVASPGETKEPDTQAQAAAQFEKEFYEKYPDLRSYGALVDDVAAKLEAVGYTAPTQDEVMETFARQARLEVAHQKGALATRRDNSNALVLGWRYEHGSDVEQDYAKAAYWYRIATEGGDPVAMNNLGALYQSGRGVPQDDVEACGLYRRAALQGNATALDNLGTMYATGRGIPRDATRAYAMFCAAARWGSTNAVRNQERLAGLLSAEQISEGRKRADVLAKFKPGE